ncbi:MAG: hypothetical protein ABI747_01970 [Candidatus Moraniibacteriota bacterium]
MAISFWGSSKKASSMGASPLHDKPNPDGTISKRELSHEVEADLRRSGVSPRARDIVGAAASGYMDDNGFRSTGINAKEKKQLMDTLQDQRQELGLNKTTLKKVDESLNKALEN